MPDPTTNFGWDLPLVGGDGDVWGTMLNVIFNDIDTQLGLASGTGSGALPLAGGDMTGNLGIKTDTYVADNLGNLSGTMVVDLDDARFFYGTAAAAYGFSFSNVPAAGKATFIMLEITNGGAYTVTWPSSFKWPGGSPPTLTTAGVDLVGAYTRDGGTTWRAAIAQTDSA